MGNPAWGHGYHKGFGDGAKQGGVIGGLITLGATALVSGGVWLAGKLLDRSAARQVIQVADTEEAVPVEADNSEDFRE